MNRVFKIVCYGRGTSGRLKQIKKRIYESEEKFLTHCIAPVKVYRVLSDGTKLIEESTYDRYKKLYVSVKLFELIDGVWVEIKK